MKKRKNTRKPNPVIKRNGENLTHLLLNKLKDNRRELKSLKNKEKNNLLVTVLAAQKNERHNISKALHDSLCQTLYAIRLNLLSIPELKHSKTELNRINLLIDQAIKETRNLSHSLSPYILKNFGFTAGIKEMSHRLSTNSFRIRSYLKGAMDLLPSAIQLCLFRIIQELVNNCIKHASASKVVITVKEKKEKIKIMVRDNGKGFDVDHLEALKNGMGLRNISDQIFLLNGKLRIKTATTGTAFFLSCNKQVNLESENIL